MQDNILDLPAEEQVQPAQGMVAQLASLVRSFSHELEQQNEEELQAHHDVLVRMDCEADTATESARDLIRAVVESELKRRQTEATDG